MKKIILIMVLMFSSLSAFSWEESMCKVHYDEMINVSAQLSKLMELKEFKEAYRANKKVKNVLVKYISKDCTKYITKTKEEKAKVDNTLLEYLKETKERNKKFKDKFNY